MKNKQKILTAIYIQIEEIERELRAGAYDGDEAHELYIIPQADIISAPKNRRWNTQDIKGQSQTIFTKLKRDFSYPVWIMKAKHQSGENSSYSIWIEI